MSERSVDDEFEKFIKWRDERVKKYREEYATVQNDWVKEYGNADALELKFRYLKAQEDYNTAVNHFDFNMFVLYGQEKEEERLC